MAVTSYRILKAANERNLARDVQDLLDLNVGWGPLGDAYKDGPFHCIAMAIGAPTGSSDLLSATPGSVEASKAVVVDASSNIQGFGTIGAEAIEVAGLAINPIVWVTVDATAAVLDGAGSVLVMDGGGGTDQYLVREIFLIGGGTNFGAGGDRLLDLTDGTTVYTQIANADLESAPAATLRWGAAKVPFLTGTAATPTTAGDDLVFEYSGGASDHTTGSISFAVCLEKVA